MRRDPIAEKARRHGDLGATFFDTLEAHIAQPAAIGGIAIFGAQPRPYPHPLGLDLAPLPQCFRHSVHSPNETLSRARWKQARNSRSAETEPLPSPTAFTRRSHQLPENPQAIRSRRPL